MTNEPILQCIILLRAWFFRHRLYPERTNTFVFGFVFVLAHEQPISSLCILLIFYIAPTAGMAGHPLMDVYGGNQSSAYLAQLAAAGIYPTQAGGPTTINGMDGTQTAVAAAAGASYKPVI